MAESQTLQERIGPFWQEGLEDLVLKRIEIKRTLKEMNGKPEIIYSPRKQLFRGTGTEETENKRGEIISMTRQQ